MKGSIASQVITNPTVYYFLLRSVYGYQSTRHTVNSSHGHLVTRSTRHRSTRHMPIFFTQSTRHTVKSSHGHLVTRSTRHAVNSSRYRGSGVDLGGTGRPSPRQKKICGGQRRYYPPIFRKSNYKLTH